MKMKEKSKKMAAILLSVTMVIPQLGQGVFAGEKKNANESPVATTTSEIEETTGTNDVTTTSSVEETTVDVSKKIPDFVVKDYYKYTGKIMIYFTEIEDSQGYNLYLDDDETPIKEISGSGEYISKEDLNDIPDGDHRLRIVRIDKNGVENEWEETTIRKQDYEYVFTEIPQVYIYTANEITDEYHEDSDVIISVIDKDGGACKDIIDNECNIKIRGNSTASADKKPWNIKFGSKTNVLNMGKGKKWCLLANAYDKSLMRNKLAYDFGRQTGLTYTSDSRYVDVYINGKYNGNYLLTVPVEVKKERINIDAYNADSNDILLELGTRYETDVNHFKTGTLGVTFDVNDPEKEGDLDSQLVLKKINRVKQYLTEFEDVLTIGYYPEICNYIDVDSFVDMYIASEFFKNADFNFSSTRFYIKNNKIYAGPLWDFDLSCGNYNPRTYSNMYEDGESYKGIFCKQMPWYEKLFECEEFDQLVKKRYAKRQFIIQNMYKVGSESELSIDYLVANYGKSFERDSAKVSERGAGWSLQGGGGYVGIGYTTTAKWTQWEQPIEFVRDWMKNRNEWLCEQWGIDLQEAYLKSDPTNQEETTTPVVVETTAATAVETTAQVNVETTAATAVETTAQVNVETTAPITVETTTKAGVETTTKAGVETTTKTGVETTTASDAKTTAVPNIKISSAKKAKAKIKVRLKKSTKGINGYELIFYSKKVQKNNNIILKTKVSQNKKRFVIKNNKFKKFKKIYVKIRAYKIVKGKKYYSAKWSSMKRVKK